MSTTRAALRPQTTEQVQDALQQAASEGVALRVVGGDTRRGMSGASPDACELHVAGLSGITNYEPEELVVSLRAGTPLHEVEAALAARGQALSFEPPDLSALLGSQPARTTIGGVIGTGFAGPRRLSVGNVRDHVLGFDAVSGRGEAFRAGGRVIKNVTGYDLAKLMVGSWGTLAVVTDLTLRALPKPPYEATVLVAPADVATALAILREVLALPLEASCAAVLPDGRAAIRLEGFRASVEERQRQLAARLDGRGGMKAIEQEESAQLWRGVRDVTPFCADRSPVWRLSLPSTAAAGVVAAIARFAPCRALYDWGGSLVWLSMQGAVAHAVVRAEVSRAGGHAWLVRAGADAAGVSIAPPLDRALAALSRRVKTGFDPLGCLGHGPFADLRAPASPEPR